ncbi:MAG: DUF952 domain-containing protein [Rhizomicrobium sp.]
MIFKIAQTADWAGAERTGRFAGSAHDQADGFIHFSTASQLAETLARYYSGVDGLLLIAVDESELGSLLKWESSPSRGEDFPHLYGPLLLSAVKWTHPLLRDAQGRAVIPEIALAKD